MTTLQDALRRMQHNEHANQAAPFAPAPYRPPMLFELTAFELALVVMGTAAAVIGVVMLAWAVRP